MPVSRVNLRLKSVPLDFTAVHGGLLQHAFGACHTTCCKCHAMRNFLA